MYFAVCDLHSLEIALDSEEEEEEEEEEEVADVSWRWLFMLSVIIL